MKGDADQTCCQRNQPQNGSGPAAARYHLEVVIERAIVETHLEVRASREGRKHSPQRRQQAYEQ
jgi:hypothetical protein